VDPVQAGRVGDQPWEIRTSPYPDPDEDFDVAFAAGFHHTHARIAAECLDRDRDVVVEKPLATTREELDRVLRAAQRSQGRIFVAYQRRYSLFNDYLREDLALGPRAPVSLSAIVYEAPLPRRHWYRWPASRGRIVSNGCHWIDYFLFLNDFEEVKDLHVRANPDGDHVVQARLRNGANLALVLTEEGSPRLNVRDTVRIACGPRSAVIVDQCRYESEGPARVIRRARTRRADSFDRMYTAIAQAIASRGAGDGFESLRVSGGAVLDAQDMADAAIGRH
jgi:predicted dehydrogenase